MKYKVVAKHENSAMCLVCGTKNDASAAARFYTVEREDGEQVLLTIFTPQERHQSYPGRMHGGMASTILDEAIGRAATILVPGIWGVTIDLNVKFRKPTPLDEDLYCESKITKMGSRGFEGEGKLFRANGEICATATAKYLTLTAEQISPEGMDDENWFMVHEDLPEYITIGSTGE